MLFGSRLRIVNSRLSPFALCFRCSSLSLAMSDRIPRVFVTRRIPPDGLRLLRDEGLEILQWDRDENLPREELLGKVADIDGLFCLLTDKVDEELLAATDSKRFKVVSTMSVGYDHIDLAACEKRGIPVGYTPDILTDATAELTVGLLLATSRRLLEAAAEVKNGGWGTWSPLWMCGASISGATIGIVGLGRIGLAVAQRLKPFGVARIVYHGRRDKSDDEPVRALDAEFRANLDDLLSESDFVVVTCALNEATKSMFDKNVFAKMKKSAIFVNTSRGALVEQRDLYEALRDGVIAAAGLDVTSPEPLPLDDPLLTLNNCVVLPHIGSATTATRNAMSSLAARNLIRGIRGEPLETQVVMS